MVVEEGERNGYSGGAMSIGPKTEATDNNNDEFLVESSSGGGIIGEGTSADGLIIYKRRKRRKMSNSDEIGMSEFIDKIKASDNSVSYQDTSAKLSSGAFVNRPGECSPGHCTKIVLQKLYQSLNGSEGGLRECIHNALTTHSDRGPSADKESLDFVERSIDQTHNSTKEVGVSGVLNEAENSTNTELCRRAFFEILMSEKFSELCGLLLKNFGDFKADHILDISDINSRMKDGAYETLPMLYLTDIQQVWTKLQKVGNDMVALAKSLSDKSRTHCEQFVSHEQDTLVEPRETDACGVFGASSCRGCGEDTDVGNCLVCDSCEEMYHVSCVDLAPPGIPRKSWYCSKCISNGFGSPHENCVVCEKLKSAPRSRVDGIITREDELEDISYKIKADVYRTTYGSQSSRDCYICKSQVKTEDNYRTCGHPFCSHKFYHYRCLSSKQLGAYGPCWYCPSCLCQDCLMDKDDNQIVLCDSCDQAYHIYCMSPPRTSVPEGTWFCAKCDKDLKRIRKAKRVYEKMQNEVKIMEGVGEVENKNVNEAEVAREEVEQCEERDKSGGLEMLVTAAKTLSRQEHLDARGKMR